jgi:hypothetical protein
MIRKLFWVVILITNCVVSYGQQNLSSKEATAIKSKKLIVVVPLDSIKMQVIKNSFESNWKLHDSINYMTSKEAMRLMRKEPNTYVKVLIGNHKGVLIETERNLAWESKTYLKVTSTVYGQTVKLYIYDDSSDALHSIGFPSGKALNEETFQETLRRFQFTINEIESDGSWVKTFRDNDEYLEELKELKLLVPIAAVKDSAQMSKYNALYPYEMDFVSQSTIDSLIKISSPDHAYLVIVEEIANVHIQYICTTKDSKFLNHYHHKIQNKATVTEGTKDLNLNLESFKKLIGKLI